jgi:hypothetical protein
VLQSDTNVGAGTLAFLAAGASFIYPKFTIPL